VNALEDKREALNGEVLSANAPVPYSVMYSVVRELVFFDYDHTLRVELGCGYRGRITYQDIRSVCAVRLDQIDREMIQDLFERGMVYGDGRKET
jgi:hypothetical protein